MQKKVYVSGKYHSAMISLNNVVGKQRYGSKANDLRPVTFKEGKLVLDLDDKMDKEIDEVMAQHSENKANGGKIFWEQPLEEEAAIAQFEKGNFAKLPKDGLSEILITDLTLLQKVSENVKGFSKADIYGALDSVKTGLSVVGLPKFNDKSSAKSLGATATVLLDILEENEIEIPEINEEGKDIGEALVFLQKVSLNHKGVAKATILSALDLVKGAFEVDLEYSAENTAAVLGEAAKTLLEIVNKKDTQDTEDGRKTDTGAGSTAN